MNGNKQLVLYINNHLKENDIIILHDRNWTPELLERLLDKHNVKTYSTPSYGDVNHAK